MPGLGMAELIDLGFSAALGLAAFLAGAGAAALTLLTVDVDLRDFFPAAAAAATVLTAFLRAESEVALLAGERALVAKVAIMGAVGATEVRRRAAAKVFLRERMLMVGGFLRRKKGGNLGEIERGGQGESGGVGIVGRG